MGDKVDVQLVNARQFRRAFLKAGGDKTMLKEAFAVASRMVTAQGKSDAPHRSGRLAGTVRGSGTLTAAIVRGGTAAVPYANPIHWGWGRRHIKANPFLSHAAQNTQPDWLPAFEAAVNKALETISQEST